MPIYMDGDACPVKAEVYRVARRYEIKVYVVANTLLRVPPEDLIELVVVKGGFDAADDWIAERINEGDIAITADIPLADRCLKRGAHVLGPKGVEFTEDAIGNALATRSFWTCSGSPASSAAALPPSSTQTAPDSWQGSMHSSTRSAASSESENVDR